MPALIGNLEREVKCERRAAVVHARSQRVASLVREGHRRWGKSWYQRRCWNGGRTECGNGGRHWSRRRLSRGRTAGRGHQDSRECSDAGSSHATKTVRPPHWFPAAFIFPP